MKNFFRPIKHECPIEKLLNIKASEYYYVPLYDGNKPPSLNGKLLRVKVGSKVDEMIQNMRKLNYNTDPLDTGTDMTITNP